MVTNVVIDYMHIVCLGVVKKLITLWFDKGQKSVRFNDSSKVKLQEIMKKVHDFIPDGFNKPIDILQVSKWRAHDFRQFLLYTGPVVLNGILKKDAYDNFITLSLAISILVCPTMCKNENYVNYAEKFIILFVRQFQKLYGAECMTHNVHCLLHLANDVRRYGSLDCFSAFRFENYIGKIKTLLRKGEKPLQQLSRRFGELKHLESKIEEHVDNIQFQDCHLQYNDSRENIVLFNVALTSSLKIECLKQNDSYLLLKSG